MDTAVEALASSVAISQLAGRRAIVVTGEMPLGRSLAKGLKRHGARVVELKVAFESRSQAEAALGDAATELGGADLIVHACATPQALTVCPIADLEKADWNAAVHKSILTTLFCLQAAHASQRERGGAVVVVGPSTAFVGAAGLIPLMALVEAQRTLVKSAARQWGGLGMRLNWVGVAPGCYDPALAKAPMPQTPELGPPPPALRRVPEPEADVADVIAWLGSDGARGITGASFNLDGGDWMVP